MKTHAEWIDLPTMTVSASLDGIRLIVPLTQYWHGALISSDGVSPPTPFTRRQKLRNRVYRWRMRAASMLAGFDVEDG